MEAVAYYPVPSNVKEVRQFLGLASYYRRFVSCFAKTVAPLHQLLAKGITFDWTPECQQAFEDLKEKLVSSPVLTFPNFDKSFVLETDTSIQGLGAVLSQKQADGKLHPVAYASRSLATNEERYAITDLETLAVVWAISHFQYYLYGHDVTVCTDHQAVKAILGSPNASGKHARWWSKVYSSGLRTIDITYRPGRENNNADALSRQPCQLAPVDNTASPFVQVASILTDAKDAMMQQNPIPSKFGVEQQKDAILAAVIEYLTTGTLPPDNLSGAKRLVARSSELALVDGILYHLGRKCSIPNRQAVVPKHLRAELLQQMHGGLMAGHFSGPRIYHSLSCSWWWDGMYRDAVEFPNQCAECAVSGRGARPGRPPLEPIPVQRPFQIRGIDIMEPPVTKKGNRYVVVLQDLFTKWPLVFPTPDQKSPRLVRLIVDELIPVFGVPEAILSDRGANLLSHLMMDICELLGIRKLNTTAYHPQCNGMVKRFNRTLKGMLRAHACSTVWKPVGSHAPWSAIHVPEYTP